MASAVDAVVVGMSCARHPFLRLLASAAFVVAVWAIGGCNTTGFSDEGCEAALDRCGYLYTPIFCRTTPSACTIEGKLYTDARTAVYLPPNQTITIDISSAGLGERAVDMSLGACFQASIEDFQIRLDGIDVSSKGSYGDVQGEKFYQFPGHTGAPRKLEVTWKGTVKGELSDSPLPEICVAPLLQQRACIDKVFVRECYNPDTE